MKLNKSKLAILLLAASTVSVSYMSHAASFSAPDTSSVSLDIVSATGSSSMKLTHAAALPDAGVLTNQGVVVATAVNTIIGAPAQSGIRFTPGLATQNIDVSDNSIVTLHGTNPSNDLILGIKDLGDADWVNVLSDTYLVTNAPVQAQSLDIALSSAQTIAADTYNLSMDGAVYNP